MIKNNKSLWTDTLSYEPKLIISFRIVLSPFANNTSNRKYPYEKIKSFQHSISKDQTKTNKWSYKTLWRQKGIHQSVAQKLTKLLKRRTHRALSKW